MQQFVLNFTNHLNNNVWLTNFIRVLYGYCTEEEMSYINMCLLNYYKNSKETPEIDNYELNTQEFFLNFLRSKLHSLGFVCMKEAFNKALNNEEGYDFINGFIRYFVMKNIDDVRVCTNIPTSRDESFFSKAGCLIGEYLLASVELTKKSESILFDYLEVNPNVRRLGLGNMLMQQIMLEVSQIYPKCDLYANNVLKSNANALLFYKSIGGEISNSAYNECYSVIFSKEVILERTRLP